MQILKILTEEEKPYGWFQQDSATACTSTQALSDVFRDRNISNGIWPAHSPNLNPCDFFFCGSLRDKVYNINHLSEELTLHHCRPFNFLLNPWAGGYLNI
jgi:hypothetical protein